MINLIKLGRIIFALGIMALGIMQFFTHDYIIGRPPPLLWPEWAAAMPGKLAWAYLSGAILIIACFAIILNKKAISAAFVIATMILAYSFAMRHLPAMADWINAYKSLALGGGALIVAASFFKMEDNSSGNFFSKNNLLLTGCIFLSLFLIICGISHFKFDEFVKNFIPAYIPVRSFWTYFTAVALIAGGVGLIFNKTRSVTALLAGIMVLLWFVLLHIPRAIAAPHDYGEWMGVCESFTFGGIFFILAGLTSKQNSA